MQLIIITNLFPQNYNIKRAPLLYQIDINGFRASHRTHRRLALYINCAKRETSGYSSSTSTELFARNLSVRNYGYIITTSGDHPQNPLLAFHLSWIWNFSVSLNVDMTRRWKQLKGLACCLDVYSSYFRFIVLIAVFLLAVEVTSISVPISSCYVLDNSSRIVDFSNWIGHSFEYEGKESDLVVRFCRDVESRSQSGYVDFGRFDRFSHFVAGSGHIDFVQRFYYGDLVNCERSPDKMGRTAQVNLMCGNCINGQCKGGLGCICNITYESNCRVLVDLAIPCENPGPRVFKGFTVGFHPRSWEIVYNGLTQLGYEKPHRDFSFRTEHTHVALYMTSIASLSTLVRRPTIKVFPENGLEIKLLGSGASGSPPTTLSPTMLVIEWRCDLSANTLYEVNVTVPVENYEPIQFFLTKLCEYRQGPNQDSTRGWATFGLISCIFTVSLSLFCCGGFIYKTRVEGQRGVDALPGMTILSACLDAMSGTGQSHTKAEDLNSAFANEVAWDRMSTSAQSSWASTERKNYGSM